MHEFLGAEKALTSYLNTGAFLVSGDNVMTVSWGFIGVMWGKKILIAPIRKSRYTKSFVDISGEFTLSVPESGKMRKEIAFCGSRSGRDTDKWSECEMEKQKAKKVSSYVVKGCEKYYECKVLTVLEMADCDLAQFEKWYPTKDLHSFYFAEIVAEY